MTPNSAEPKPPEATADQQCECPARKALQRMMDEHGHDCDCGIPRVLCEYCEGRAALSAPCPCEGLRAELTRERDPRVTRSLAWLLANRTAERDALQTECDSLRAELAKAERWETGFRNIVTAIVGPRAEFDISEIVEAVKALQAELAASQERERGLREALQRIAQYKPEEFDYTEDQKVAWRAAVAACPECIRYAGHPIQQGICDEHRRFLYQREETNAHRKNTQDLKMRGIATSALATPEGTK